MRFARLLLRRKSRSIDSLKSPWGARPAIYDHVLRHLPLSGRGLLPGGQALPDDEVFWSRKKVRWVPGGLDGVAGRHYRLAQDDDKARQVLEVLDQLIAGNSKSALRGLYDAVSGSATIEYVDPLLKLLQEGKQDGATVREIAIWLAKRSPDREPVKLGIALLGLVGLRDDVDLVESLGRHEEFTLYSGVVIKRLLPAPDMKLMELGKHVDGWGRVHIIERLNGTSNTDVRRWMLREGYRNSVMYEYTAYICAKTGDLREEIAREEVDDETVTAAGDIIAALIDGGPAEDIFDYEDGAAVAQRLVAHLRRRRRDLRWLDAVYTLGQFARSDDMPPAAERLGWTPAMRRELAEECGAVLSDPRWKEVVRAELDAPDGREFWRALKAADAFGLDAWDACIRRVERGEDYWYEVMKTNDVPRIRTALGLAERLLPLEEMATGPGVEDDFGEGFDSHRRLTWVLQRLGAFPGLGWPLIRAGLKSPLVANRQAALKALGSWDRTSWTTEITSTVEHALDEEPDEETRKLAHLAYGRGRQSDA